MNKMHCVIWSQTRNCFVVASEKTKARGKPSTTRKTIAAAITALFLTPTLASAIGCDVNTSITTALPAQCYNIDQNVTIANTGSIATTTATSAVYVSPAPYTSTFTNNGTINAAYSGTSSATRYGINFGSSMAGTLTNTNSGTISASAIAQASSASITAIGVYVGGNLSGTLTNSGTISATASAEGSSVIAYATGISVASNLSGTLSNFGTINATANGLASASALAYGVRVAGDLSGSGTLTNSGTIAINATANHTNSAATAFGIFVINNLAGTLTNSGTISATANNSSSRAKAYGISVFNNLSGMLENSGTISATANGFLGSAYGVYAGGNLDGTLRNSGTIRATGLGGVSDADVYSIYAPNGIGTINNQTGGLLDGRLTAGGAINVINDGTLITRLQQSSAGGDYTQGATGVLEIGAVNAGSYGKLSVGGTVTLAADTIIRVKADPAHTLAAGNTLNNVIFAGTTLAMSTLKVQDNIMALNFTASDDASNGVDLTAAASGLTTVAAAVGGGSTGAASVLDGMMSNPNAQLKELGDFLYELGASGTASEVANKVSQALPLFSGSLAQVTASNLHNMNRIVQARMDQNLGLSSGDNFESNRKAWVKPLGSWADQENRDGVFGYYAKTFGVALGADSDLSQASRLGAAFAYSNSMVDGNSGLQAAKINSYQLALYGMRSLNQSTEFNWHANYGYNKNNGSRRIGGLTAVSDYISHSYYVGVGIGHTMAMNEKTRLTPSFRADYTRIHSDGYSETGAGALNLNAVSQTAHEFIFAVDGKITHALSDASMLTANLGLGYDTQAKRSSVTSAFQGGGAVFSTTGIDPSPTLLRGGLGMVINTHNAMQITARYDIKGRSSGFTEQTASVKFRMPF